MRINPSLRTAVAICLLAIVGAMSTASTSVAVPYPLVKVTSPTFDNPSGIAMWQPTGAVPVTFEPYYFPETFPLPSTFCAVDAAAYSACSSPWVTPTLGNGLHSLYIKAVGSDASESATTPINFGVDTTGSDATPPVISIQPLAGGITMGFNVLMHFTYVEDHPRVMECWFDTGIKKPCSPQWGTGWGMPMLPEGPHTYHVRIEDVNANVTESTYDFYVDTTPPVLAVISPKPSEIVRSATPDVQITSSDGKLYCAFDPIGLQQFPFCGSHFAPGPLADGSHRLAVSAVDAAGNNTSVEVDFFVDATTPVTVKFRSKRHGRPKRKSFRTMVSMDLSGAVTAQLPRLCQGYTRLQLVPTAKPVKNFELKVPLQMRNNHCQANAIFRLPLKYKGKRAKITASIAEAIAKSQASFTGEVIRLK